MNLSKSVFATIGVLLLLYIKPHSIYGDNSSYTASSFAKFCSDNPSICKKIDVGEEKVKAGIKCPDYTNQLVEKVYVHAGNGQTVYEMPHEGFIYTINQNGAGSANVEKTTHKHDLSWIAVVCGSKNASPSPTPTSTPTLTLTPTQTPTPTPTGNGGETPTPTPTEIISVTPTPTVSVTPTPTHTGASGGNSSSGESGRGGVEGYVLGATTLGATGENYSEVPTLLILGGISLIIEGLRIRYRKVLA